MTGGLRPHHVGICVSDLERSLRFWRDGLGFETTTVYEMGQELAGALEVEGEVSVTAHFLVKDGFVFELLHYPTPGVHGAPSTSRNQLGFTHFSVTVDDLDAALQRVVAHGGAVLESTRTRLGPGFELVFVTDPDGVRVELMTGG